MNTYARSGAAALAAALTFTLAACGSGSTATSTSAAASSTSAAGASPTSTPSSMMSSPMMSGSAPATTSSPAASADHNAADVTFAQMMIVHHQGAVEMADLAPSRAASQDVKDLAVRIKAAQGPEIEQMQTWLTAWGSAAPTTTSEPDDGMGHGGMSDMGEDGDTSTGMAMPGMMSDEQMQELTDANGAEFDRLFLEMMIMHHQGAIEMADTEIAEGSNPAALALAESIKTSQTAEIAEMQQLLQTL
jgi:uncharacterized protein (DUF305 family)